MDAGTLAVAAAAAGVLAVSCGRRWRRRHVRAPLTAVQHLLQGTATPLGDAALVFEAGGPLVWANEAALALSADVAAALVARASRVLGDDVVTLRRGLERGPAAGRITIPTPAGPVIAQAAVTRVEGPAPVDVVLLRFGEPTPEAGAACEVSDGDILPEPPPLPVRRRSAPVPPAQDPASSPATALAAELGGSLARSSSAAALLRMVLPPGHADAAHHLGRIEAELRHAEAMLAALTSPLATPVRRTVDVDALLSEAIATLPAVESIQLERDGRSAQAIADPAQLRQALRHVLQVAVARMPCGGTLSVRTRAAGAVIVIEIADTGAPVERQPGLDLPLAQRLVAAQGGAIHVARSPGRGSLTRVSLPAARAVRAAGA